MASPRGQNQKGSQMQEKTNFDDVVGDGGGSELEYLKISLSAGTLGGASKDLFTKDAGKTVGATKIQGGLGEQRRELKAERVRVTHSALLGKHASSGPDPYYSCGDSGIRKPQRQKPSLSCLSTLWVL